MCTLAVYAGVGAEVPLLVAANRDEFLARSTAAPRILSLDPWVIGGQDLEAGGTWLGLNEHGLVVALLNRRSLAVPDGSRQSRGLLCLRALQCGDLAAVEALLRAEEGRQYNPFTLLAASADGILVGVSRAADIDIAQLSRGVHVLSNLEVDDRECPRIARSFARFAAFRPGSIRAGESPPTALRGILAEHSSRGDSVDLAEDDGLCIHRGPYGTRSSSIIAIAANGSAYYWHSEGPPCRSEYALVPLPPRQALPSRG